MKNILWGILIMLLLSVNYGYSQDHKDQTHEHAMGEMTMHGERNDPGICPVIHGKASKDYSYTYEGKTYYFCCPSCLEEFKREPQKYISRIKEIKLEAYQFGFSPDRIIVKKGDIVRLDMTSRDVPHGVYIKGYGINVAVKKGETRRKDFIADKPGEFDIICSVYCGRGHSQMKGKLIVEE